MHSALHRAWYIVNWQQANSSSKSIGEVILRVWFQTSSTSSTPEADRNADSGQPGWLSGLAPPSAQGVILETWDRVPRPAPCMELASPSACVCLCVCVCVCVSHE